MLHAAAEWSEHIAFSGNGKLLAVANATRLHVFDSSGAEQAMIADHAGNIAALAWRPKLTEAGRGLQRRRAAASPRHTRGIARL